MSESDDDLPTLSAHTLAALQEFYSETRTSLAHSTTPSDQFAVGAVAEDWVSLRTEKVKQHLSCETLISRAVNVGIFTN